MQRCELSQTNIHAIVMPNEICNLACSYCYVLEKHSGRMSVTLAERIIDELLAHNTPDRPTRLIWHGGEPMLAGIEFYKHVCSYIRSRFPGHEVEHYIQSNGTLLTDEWIDFFLEEQFQVGVSVDGWEELHDACRKTRDGRGSFASILQNVLHAQSRGLVVGILSVVTRHTLGKEEELFRFFYEHRLDFGFHPITSLTPWMDQQLAITSDEFADTSIKLFDLGFFQPEPRVTSVAPTIHYVTALLLGCASGFCVMSEACAEEYLSFEPNGRVSVCDRFSGNSDLSFGNIGENSLSEILESPVRQAFLHRWQKTQELCQDCEWKPICNGGCPHDAYVRTGSIFERDSNCGAYKKIFQHISRTLADQLEGATVLPIENEL